MKRLFLIVLIATFFISSAYAEDYRGTARRFNQQTGQWETYDIELRDSNPIRTIPGSEGLSSSPYSDGAVYREIAEELEEDRTMKPKNKAKRLQARQKDYDEMIRRHPELKPSHRRPGSLKK